MSFQLMPVYFKPALLAYWSRALSYRQEGANCSYNDNQLQKWLSSPRKLCKKPGGQGLMFSWLWG